MPPKKKRYLGPIGGRLLKISHLLCAMIWTGCGVAMLLLLFASEPQTPDEHYQRAWALKVTDDYGIIPGAAGCLLTGILYGLKTPWGFFKHRWVAVKWAIFVVLAIAGLIALNPWINMNALLVSEDRECIRHHSVFHDNILLLMIFCPIQLAGLIFMTFISVFKPWKGRRRIWVQPIPDDAPQMSVADNI